MNAAFRTTQQGRGAEQSARASRFESENILQYVLNQHNALPPGTGQPRSQTVVQVYNGTGSLYEQFSAVGIGEPWITPADGDGFRGQIVFKAAATATRYGVCLGAIANSTMGKVAISGVVQLYGAVPPGVQVLWSDGTSGGWSIVQVGSVWSGVVVFKTQNGAQASTIAGTATPYLKVHVSDDTPGLLEYCDGSDIQNWGAGKQVYEISKIPPGHLCVP